MEAMMGRMMSGTLNFEDMLQTYRMAKRLGPMKNILKMVPGLSQAVPEEALENVDEKQTGRIEAIILSMTPKERRNPDIINGSRRKRIAAGSGTSVEEVNQLLKNFASSRRGMKEMGRMQGKMQKMQRRRR